MFSGIIIDTHRSSSYKIQKRRGVIRSHKRYPQSHRRALPPRVISIVVPASYTLYVELKRPKECFAKKDVVLRRVKHGNRTIVKEPFHKVLMFNGSEVDLLEVVVRRVPRKKSCIEGFMMPFSSKFVSADCQRECCLQAPLLTWEVLPPCAICMYITLNVLPFPTSVLCTH